MAQVLNDFRTFRTQTDVHGIERLFVSAILLLRGASFSYWLRCWLPSARGDRRWRRDNAVDLYCVAQTLILLGLLLFGSQSPLGTSIAAYILFDVFLTLANVVFVGKFPGLQAPPASIERSIILLLVNLVDIVLAFAVFYRNALDLSVPSAIFQASLVLGTVGYPSELKGTAQLIVSLQIVLDLVLSVLLLSSFVGQIGLFSKHGTPASMNPPDEPRV